MTAADPFATWHSFPLPRQCLDAARPYSMEDMSFGGHEIWGVSPNLSGEFRYWLDDFKADAVWHAETENGCITGTTIAFEDDTDATLFKLRWM